MYKDHRDASAESASLINSQNKNYVILCFCWKNDGKTHGKTLSYSKEQVRNFYFTFIDTKNCKHWAELHSLRKLLMEISQ